MKTDAEMLLEARGIDEEKLVSAGYDMRGNRNNPAPMHDVTCATCGGMFRTPNITVTTCRACEAASYHEPTSWPLLARVEQERARIERGEEKPAPKRSTYALRAIGITVLYVVCCYYLYRAAVWGTLLIEHRLGWL